MSNGQVLRSRRAFLRGGFGESREPLRPPWTREEKLHRDCTACGDCIGACPEKILIAGGGGLPEVDFTAGACTFCMACAKACPEEIFDPTALEPWSYKATVAAHCLARRGVMCQSCGDSCDARAIRFPLEAGRVPAPRIDGALCTGCGACVSVCPVEALQAEAVQVKERGETKNAR